MIADAIVLSRDDAEFIRAELPMDCDPDEEGEEDTNWAKSLLTNGSEGHSWLNAVPDDVLDLITYAMHPDFAALDTQTKANAIRAYLYAEIDRRAKLCPR
jgi:hypothetical protein